MHSFDKAYFYLFLQITRENYLVKNSQTYNLIISVFSIFARIKSQNQYLFFKLFGFVKQISLKITKF